MSMHPTVHALYPSCDIGEFPPPCGPHKWRNAESLGTRLVEDWCRGHCERLLYVQH